MAGALPTFFPSKALLASNPVIFALIIISSLAVYLGLKLIQKPSPYSKTIQL
jgi:hypothetical protein